ncbi:TIGR02117 family protein [Azospirillum sp.]|uniref:TIGR02117 family protein n=1 Tax=Azospirillum sp. TaxID=34012 RepID=UPI002D74C166|nr:TIGR02117 family protein [Azospirillum sp.]HYD66534.1 TIGR02117 family protein [Azospirillum sp.]
MQRLAGVALAVMAAIPGGFALLAYALPLIPSPGDSLPTEGVEVFVCSNGVHTDLVLPAVTDAMDWTAVLPRSDFPLAPADSTHLSFGWGDRAFYLETRRWSDLNPRTAWRALFGGGPTVVHVYHLRRPVAGEDCGRLVLGEGAYGRLVAYVRAAFRSDRPILGASYSGDDRFYEAYGTYGPVLTCNEWTARALRAAGVPMGIWTPLASGVMRWVR